MPVFAFICKDGGDKTKIRRDLLLEHLRYIETVADHIAVAGPCAPRQTSDTRQFEGSIMIYDAPSESAARAIFEGDPYFKNGIWDSYDIMAMNPVVGHYIGGQTWELAGDSITFTPPHKKK
jgi:uncharacterized protein YciI